MGEDFPKLMADRKKKSEAQAFKILQVMKLSFKSEFKILSQVNTKWKKKMLPENQLLQEKLKVLQTERK